MKTKFTSLISLFLLLASCSSSDSDEIVAEIQINLPTISTLEVLNVQQTSVDVSGSATDDGGANITDKGIVWGLSPNPDLTTNKKSSGSGTGNFSAQITNLEPNTTYYFRSYATNSKGTAYGQQLSASTLQAEPQQKVFEGDVLLTSQQEVDDFGAEGYNIINGSLTVADANNPSTIVSLSPLDNLETINGSITFDGNLMLEKLGEFPNLLFIEGNFVVSGNNALQTIAGFSKLEQVSGFMWIHSNESQFTIEGFDALTQVDGTLSITNYLPGQITGLTGFTNLEHVGGGMALGNIDALINGFGSLRTIADFLLLQSNDVIENLSFLGNLESIGGELSIQFNAALKNLLGLEKITALNGFKLTRNDSLLSLSGLNNVTLIDGDVSVEYHPLMENLNGLNGLQQIINGSLTVQYNQSMLNLTGLDNVSVIEGGIRVSYNPSLVNLIGLGSLQSMGDIDSNCFCKGSISIETNENLTSLDGLESLTTALYGDIAIRYNPKLTNLNGLRYLQTVLQNPSDSGISVSVEWNTVLNDFCGLKALYENYSSAFQVNFSLLFNATESIDIATAVSGCS